MNNTQKTQYKLPWYQWNNPLWDHLRTEQINWGREYSDEMNFTPYPNSSIPSGMTNSSTNGKTIRTARKHLNNH